MKAGLMQGTEACELLAQKRLAASNEKLAAALSQLTAAEESLSTCTFVVEAKEQKLKTVLKKLGSTQTSLYSEVAISYKNMLLLKLKEQELESAQRSLVSMQMRATVRCPRRRRLSLPKL